MEAITTPRPYNEKYQKERAASIPESDCRELLLTNENPQGFIKHKINKEIGDSAFFLNLGGLG